MLFVASLVLLKNLGNLFVNVGGLLCLLVDDSLVFVQLIVTLLDVPIHFVANSFVHSKTIVNRKQVWVLLRVKLVAHRINFALFVVKDRSFQEVFDWESFL